jgi:hypothetical protein
MRDRCYCDGDAVEAAAMMDAKDCDFCKKGIAIKYVNRTLGSVCAKCYEEISRKGEDNENTDRFCK